jgi:hypothetical protein
MREESLEGQRRETFESEGQIEVGIFAEDELTYAVELLYIKRVYRKRKSNEGPSETNNS